MEYLVLFSLSRITEKKKKKLFKAKLLQRTQLKYNIFHLFKEFSFHFIIIVEYSLESFMHFTQY